VFVVLGALTLLAYAPLSANQAPAPAPAPQERPQAPPPSSPGLPPAAAGQAQPAPALSASGELVSVDTKTKMVTVKTATGEQKFAYDDSTKIAGGKDAAGLGTMTGSQVTIRYKKDGASMLASSIDVKPAGGAPRP
jgi:hypothetical protein